MASSPQHNWPTLSCSADDILDAVLAQQRRVLLFGPPGVGKSTLTAQLAQALAQRQCPCCCISADPGSPAFGVPGAVTSAHWQDGVWQIDDYLALCTLDAGRFRLPLVTAVRCLAQAPVAGVLLLDGPGVVRGMAGRELLAGLVEAADIDAVLVLSATERSLPLANDLRGLGLEVFVVQASTQAARPGKQVRARRRTEQWDAYLAQAVTQHINLDQVNLLGAPPPLGEPGVWSGRQVAILHNNKTLAMGEVQALDGKRLQLLLPQAVSEMDTLQVRDAARSVEGFIETAPPFTSERLEYIPPADVVPSVQESGGARITGRVGHLDVALLNGVFGDPQLHLRLRHQGRSLLFDLGSGSGSGGGNGGRLPARLAHQVTDVFISHAHMDHISGFQWLLRSRLGDLPPCRVYGPPGLARHIEGFIQSFLWDRIDDRGPAFEVAELHGQQLQRYRLQAGASCKALGAIAVSDGILRQEPGFRIRAVELDHHTPVLAYAFEPEQEINVRKDRLQARGLAPGPWLASLKQQLLAGQGEAMIALPDGSSQSAGSLADELVLIQPGKKLAYATDLADTPENRQRLAALARHAHTFFCEAPFMEAEAEQAMRTGHLTTRACGEIADAAGVARLVPFHFSRRYAHAPQQLYEEIGAACSCLVAPRTLQVFVADTSMDKELIQTLEAVTESAVDKGKP